MLEDRLDMACPIHASLIRPILLAGADRNLVMINITCIAALIFGVGIHAVTVVLAVILATIGHLILFKLAKFDCNFLPIYMRHIRYQPLYLAKSRV